MSLNFSDHQLNIECYVFRMLYINLMITTIPKPRIDTHNIKAYIPLQKFTNHKENKNNQETINKTEKKLFKRWQ